MAHQERCTDIGIAGAFRVYCKDLSMCTVGLQREHPTTDCLPGKAPQTLHMTILLCRFTIRQGIKLPVLILDNSAYLNFRVRVMRRKSSPTQSSDSTRKQTR